MNYLPTALLTVLFGLGCGYFQYWMALRLEKKRWLLLLQPGLFVVIAASFTAWTLSIDRLRGSPARLAALPFWVLLLFTAGGWAAAAVKKKKK